MLYGWVSFAIRVGRFCHMLDLSAAGVLEQVGGAAEADERLVDREALASLSFQILASPEDADAHVTAVLALARAAPDGTLRAALAHILNSTLYRVCCIVNILGH